MAYGIRIAPYGTWTWAENLADFGTISNFQREVPEPKVVKVDIPAGLDLDITDAVGLGWHDGTDTFDIYITTDTEAERLEAMRDLTTLIHGQRLRYYLSWDSDYYCQGRFSVQYERLNPHVSRASVTVDREAWRVARSIEYHDVDCHPYGWCDLEGSMRYNSVAATFLQSGGADVAVEEPITLTDRATGTHTLATDVFGESTVWLRVDSWLLYVDGDNLVVNSSKFSVSGNNATINATGTVTDGDLHFADADKQKVTVQFRRWDV